MSQAPILRYAAVALLALAPLAAASCSSESDSNPAPGKDASTRGSSFKADVVPIVQASCALTACHSSKESNLGIFLGYDAGQIYAELQKTSAASGQKFIVPGDPTNSYVMVKLEGRQKVGSEMPPGEKLSAADLEVFSKWILAGAKND